MKRAYEILGTGLMIKAQQMTLLFDLAVQLILYGDFEELIPLSIKSTYPLSALLNNFYIISYSVIHLLIPLIHSLMHWQIYMSSYYMPGPGLALRTQ